MHDIYHCIFLSDICNNVQYLNNFTFDLKGQIYKQLEPAQAILSGDTVKNEQWKGMGTVIFCGFVAKISDANLCKESI